jgi:hypothetical protein
MLHVRVCVVGCCALLCWCCSGVVPPEKEIVGATLFLTPSRVFGALHGGGGGGALFTTLSGAHTAHANSPPPPAHTVHIMCTLSAVRVRARMHASGPPGFNPFLNGSELVTAIGQPFNDNPLLEAADFGAPALVASIGVAAGLSSTYPRQVTVPFSPRALELLDLDKVRCGPARTMPPLHAVFVRSRRAASTGWPCAGLNASERGGGGSSRAFSH